MTTKIFAKFLIIYFLAFLLLSYLYLNVTFLRFNDVTNSLKKFYGSISNGHPVFFSFKDWLIIFILALTLLYTWYSQKRKFKESAIAFLLFLVVLVLLKHAFPNFGLL